MAHAARQQLSSILRGHHPRVPLASAGPSSSRHFSATASREENLKETKKWFRVTAVGFVGVFSLAVYNLMNPEHPGEHERPEYSYLRIRNKEFPWGPHGLFERKHHDH
ncbi:hypothetical protein GOP47_0025782 [Adiantum capillus-veneris]|uniref:Uncharacterized protein n=1 Tax=Adiantum capillus-veneris TaxID=13818 RepID=A0A9D4U1V7_ADICA|nr:hypothetical protein GOP47_0025782 [Adiantum capillus-veneris]